MNNIFFLAILNIVTVLLFGWVLIELYDAQLQFVEVMENPEPPWAIEMNAFPFLLLFVICVPIYIYLLVRTKRERKSVWKAFMLPMEFKETDERERMITAKACRGSYVVMMFAMPIAAGLLIMYPTIQDTLPYYPIIIVILLLLIQMISYFYTLHKNFSKVSGL